MHENHDYVINSTGHENRVNELEETASTRSSFADLWDSTSIEVCCNDNMDLKILSAVVDSVRVTYTFRVRTRWNTH